LAICVAFGKERGFSEKKPNGTRKDRSSNVTQPPNNTIPHFVRRAEVKVATAATQIRGQEARNERVRRRFNLAEICEMTGFHRKTVLEWMQHPDAPVGTDDAQRRFNLEDLMRLRLINEIRGGRKRTLHWRKPGDPLPIVTFSSQKGGTAKSLSAAHYAQYLSLNYGLRVGFIDADPQATGSLYFADNKTDVAGIDADTFTRFMGVYGPGDAPVDHSPEELDAFWTKTPWPGVRLMPGGAPIQEAEIPLFFLAQGKDPRYKRVYRLLHDALDRWSSTHPPKTDPSTLATPEGRIDEGRFQDALHETLDVIIVDCAPTLSLVQLNTIVAATSMIVPITMRGFDMNTLRVFLSGLRDYLDFIEQEKDPVRFAHAPSYILPTIVSTASDNDIRQVGELYAHDRDIVCPIFYSKSEAVANAARDFQSIYEYDAPKARRQAARTFVDNANAVGDAICARTLPLLPSKGYANAHLIKVFGEGVLPPWTGVNIEENAA